MKAATPRPLARQKWIGNGQDRIRARRWMAQSWWYPLPYSRPRAVDFTSDAGRIDVSHHAGCRRDLVRPASARGK
jgi:hypothetical protein